MLFQTAEGEKGRGDMVRFWKGLRRAAPLFRRPYLVERSVQTSCTVGGKMGKTYKSRMAQRPFVYFLYTL